VFVLFVLQLHTLDGACVLLHFEKELSGKFPDLLFRELVEVWRGLHIDHCARPGPCDRYGVRGIVCGYRFWLLQGGDAFVRADLIPRQANDQCTELFGAQFDAAILPDLGRGKPALVQPPRRQP